jgi:hypothetical protein
LPHAQRLPKFSCLGKNTLPYCSLPIPSNFAHVCLHHLLYPQLDWYQQKADCCKRTQSLMHWFDNMPSCQNYLANHTQELLLFEDH